MVLQFMLEGNLVPRSQSVRGCRNVTVGDLGTRLVGRAMTVHNPLFECSHSVEYLNTNVSIGQLLQHISKSVLVCALSRPKMILNKNI